MADGWTWRRTSGLYWPPGLPNGIEGRPGIDPGATMRGRGKAQDDIKGKDRVNLYKEGWKQEDGNGGSRQCCHGPRGPPLLKYCSGGWCKVIRRAAVRDMKNQV